MRHKTNLTNWGVSEQIIGRTREHLKITACIDSQHSVLIEGPVGVGKTYLISSIVKKRGVPFFRIDGDSRYSEQKLTGWFDPPLVMKSGYNAKSFIDGPLTSAMKMGGVLFINELNRMPEGVQNILLPAMDEKIISIPKLGNIVAKRGFLVIATQNPKEFVATSHLSEALMDRFEWIYLDYQSVEEETEIVSLAVEKANATRSISSIVPQNLAQCAVHLTRMSRTDPRVSRGASVRSAISLAKLTIALIDKLPFESAVTEAALLALPTRIELNQDSDSDISHSKISIENIVLGWVKAVLAGSLGFENSGVPGYSGSIEITSDHTSDQKTPNKKKVQSSNIPA